MFVVRKIKTDKVTSLSLLSKIINSVGRGVGGAMMAVISANKLGKDLLCFKTKEKHAESSQSLFSDNNSVDRETIRAKKKKRSGPFTIRPMLSLNENS